VALREWKNNNHDVADLLGGVALTVAGDWLRKRADEMTQEERDFIQVSANRHFLTWQEWLKVALRVWKNTNHDSGAMLRGASLTVAEDWLRKCADEMTQEERDFIQVSAKERDRERQKKQRRRRLTIIGLSGLSMIALALAGLAGVGWCGAAINQINSLAQNSDAFLNLDRQKP
jgi:hypothetical protein